MTKLIHWLRCKINRPATYRQYPENGDTDWWYVMCCGCHRQTEVAHERWVLAEWKRE